MGAPAEERDTWYPAPGSTPVPRKRTVRAVVQRQASQSARTPAHTARRGQPPEAVARRGTGAESGVVASAVSSCVIGCTPHSRRNARSRMTHIIDMFLCLLLSTHDMLLEGQPTSLS